MNKEQLQDRIYQYWLLGRFDKPIGIFILLWPTLWALWVAADGRPSFHVLVVFVFGVILMRAAGCIINDYADRDFDPYVERTRQRPIASGKVKPKEALILFCVLSLVAFLLVLTLNTMTIKLSVVGVLLAASYPFMKRYTHLPQAYLGIAFGWAVPMAFAAQTGTIPLVAWLMYLAVALWALVYDTMYALVDYDDDLKIGVKSTAILFGDRFREIIAVIQGLSLGLLVLVGYLEDLSGIYYIGLAIALGLSIYQQKLIFYRNKANCFHAFLNNNWYGLVVFSGLIAHYWAV
ncbi:MAG: 4-hydroxybenzoate octaprenyltransferase [Methylococcales bacterium]|jgi:4-hydroxybenzoate polyprenyltransferase|nr:4-hydroxybenzoate octaprenyltransferase [Methylococcales bacterium]